MSKFLIYLSIQSTLWIALIIGNNEGTFDIVKIDILFYLLFLNIVINIFYIMIIIIVYIKKYRKLKDYPIDILKEMAEETTDAVIQKDPG